MATDDWILALDRQRSTARRYRKYHRSTASSERLLAAAVIEARARFRMLKARLTAARRADHCPSGDHYPET